MKLPNFVVVGAAKGGSTSLYHYLKGHPEIYIPSEYKETRFFASEMIKDTFGYNRTSVFELSEFKSLYQDADGYKAVGDFGNLYLLYHEVAINNIKKILGEDVKIVMVLREPVERAFSAYQFACRNVYESKSFEYGLKHEDERIAKHHLPPDIYHYKRYGLYSQHVKAYLENFSDVKILLSDDLRENTRDTLADLFDFLEVDTSYEPKIQVYNEGGWVPYNVKLYNWLFHGKHLATFFRPYLEKVPVLYKATQRAFIKLQGLRDKTVVKKKIELKPKTRKFLHDYYKEDIEALEKLLSKDLSHWKRSAHSEVKS